jgi:pimeloyl-ACP methyl ester carboxylesterase
VQAQTKATSADGTNLAWRTEGTGPALVLVHGSAADARDWSDVIPPLSPHFTLHALNRRGRGGSGDEAPHSLLKEAQDVAAVVTEIGAKLVLAHSFGAVAALEATRILSGVTFVLYEPPVLDAANPPIPADDRNGLGPYLEEVQQTQSADALVETFLRMAAGATDEEITMMRAMPSVWGAAVECAHTLPREAHAVSTYHWDPKRFANVRNRILLLTGDQSPPFFAAGARAIANAIAGTKIQILKGQGHNALQTSPNDVATLARQFFAAAK